MLRVPHRLTCRNVFHTQLRKERVQVFCALLHAWFLGNFVRVRSKSTKLATIDHIRSMIDDSWWLAYHHTPIPLSPFQPLR
jgi:hypothetical protein